MLHAARGPADHVLGAEAHDLFGRLPHAHEHAFYSAATPAKCAAAHATPGRLSAGRLRDLGLPIDATVYLCGPAPFMTVMREAR